MYIPGKECRNLLYDKKRLPKRGVPGFTYQALQANTFVIPPKKLELFKKRPVKETLFSIYFRRGDIPVITTGRYFKTKRAKKELPLKWYCEPTELDYCYYLPIFIDGLSDPNIEMRTLAEYAATHMILKAPQKILAVLPKLILPLKKAFNTRDKRIVISAFKILRTMVLMGPCVGQALVPYYRQLLAVCNLYKNFNVNLGDYMDVDRERRIADVIDDTLRLLERCGGPNAFINIKYMIPTYESGIYPICESAKVVPQEEKEKEKQPKKL